MLELRFHGRGGQGTVLAAKMLADAVLRGGRGECMAIPEFGVERRGAPVVAYARISQKKILTRSRIYEPDGVVLMDPTLAADPGIVRGLKIGGIMLVNSEFDAKVLARRWPGPTIYSVPARRIALVLKLGSPSSPVVNTAMCGAAVAVFGLADLASLEGAIRDAVPNQVEANLAAAREAYQLALKDLHAPAR